MTPEQVATALDARMDEIEERSGDDPEHLALVVPFRELRQLTAAAREDR